MAWYPGATRMELQPESDAQSAIRPTQFIVHSLAAPWTARRTFEYWRDSTNLESHFGLGYEGDLAQFIGTQTKADANAAANLRADGTGAISLESASNLKATDPWTDAQVEQLIKLGVWLHETHAIPLRLCRSADDPGFGYHRQFAAWNPNGHSCPGDARVTQFKTVVFPGIVARATGTTQEDDMPTPEEYAKAVWAHKLTSPTAAEGTDPTRQAGVFLAHTDAKQARLLEFLTELRTAEAAQTAAVTALAKLVGSGVDTAAVVTAVQDAITDAVIKVSVDVTGPDVTA
ncbi:peptidoglycan recognition protein family protein [Streptomyces sp. NPDC000878]